MTEAQARIGTVIRIEGLTKRYGTQKAIDGLSLIVPEGSIFGLLGENGAGKTTTIQTLLGLISPDTGHTEVLGLDPCAGVLMSAVERVMCLSRQYSTTG